MKKTFYSVLIFLFGLLAYGQQPSQFITQIYSSSSTGKIDINKYTLGPLNEFIIAGEYETDIQVQNSIYTSPKHSNYLTKIDAYGNHEWTVTFGNKSYLYIEDLDVADDGSIFISGNFKDSISIQNYSRTTPGYQPFLWKISSSGNFELAFPYRSNPTTICRPRFSAKNGELTVSIIATDSLNYGSTILRPNRSNTTVGLLARYDYQGNLLNTQTLDSPDPYFVFTPQRIDGNRIIMQLWVNNTDSIYFGSDYFAGNSKKGNWFFELDSTFTIINSSFLEYSRTAGFSYHGQNKNGDLLYTGAFSGTITDGNLSITNKNEPNNTVGLQDGFFMILDSSLQPIALESVGSSGENEILTGITELGQHYFLSGTAKGDLIYRGDTLSQNLTTQGFVLELDYSNNVKSFIQTENTSPIANTSFIGISNYNYNTYAVIGTSTVSAIFNKTDTLDRQCLLDGFIWTNTDNSISTVDYVNIDSQVNLYPNPASQFLNIQSNSPNFLSKKLNIKVFDLSGKLIFQREISGTSIDVSSLKRGLYLFMIQPYDKSSFVRQKILIQ